jgi:restriction endonuclease S subunit
MWHKTILIETLLESSTWKVDQFRESLGFTNQRNVDFVRLGDLVSERKKAVDPNSAPYQNLPYLGLNAALPNTGQITLRGSALEQEIRSRSKIFECGDLLYARLRAYQNKVALVGSDFQKGLCSGEFYILIPHLEKIHPRYLQWVLTTPEMVKYVSSHLAGATHPRLSIDALFAFKIPLPSLEKQSEAVRLLKKSDSKLLKLRQEISEMPGKTHASVSSLILGAQST